MKKAIKQINRSIKAEIRINDINTAAAGVTTAPSLTLLNGVAQGDADAQREGDQIYMKYLILKGYIQPGDPNGNLLRLVIIYDTQTNGAAPSFADLFQTLGDVAALRFWFSQKRYKFIFDKTYAVDAYKPISINIRKKLNKFTYFGNNASGGVANMIKGSLYLYTISDSGAVPNPTIEWNSRVFYTP